MIGTSLYYDKDSQYFQGLNQYLQQCPNLRGLEICFSVDVLLSGSADPNALQAYFLHGQSFISPSLVGLMTFFRGFPNLRVLKVHTAPDRPSKIMARRENGNDDFLRYAFTGSCEARLVREIRKELQHLPNMRVEVISGREHVHGYEEWKQWQSGCTR
jgi:hypothetical protein